MEEQQSIMLRFIFLIALLALVPTDASSPKHPMAAGGCGCGGGGGGGGGGGCGGGCRHKARGVLSLEGDGAIDEDFGEIYGLRLWESPKLPANVSLQQAHDPNFLFKTCCADRGLSRACQARCNFHAYNQDLLQNMMVGEDDCHLDSLPEMHFCAAQGRDHTDCCIERGVADVFAGEKCLVFCDQIPDRFTRIDYTYVSCFERFDEMKTCFYNTVSKKAKAFFRHH